MDQKVSLQFREVDTLNWTTWPVEQIGGSTITAQIDLSPEKYYEYQIIAEGETSLSSKLMQIPHYIYGYPEYKFGHKLINKKNEKMYTVNVNIGFGHPPLEPMAPESVSLEIGNKVINTIKQGNEFTGNFEIELTDNPEANIVITYKNGVVIKEKFRGMNEIIHETIYKEMEVIENR